MYLVHFSKAYNKSIRKLVKSGKVKLSDVDIVIDLIACGGVLPIKYRDHKLHGEYDGYR
jgi:mRNA-degrading endonuclease YafQ of YafQ-DinJ toxin-antitoxin module